MSANVTKFLFDREFDDEPEAPFTGNPDDASDSEGAVPEGLPSSEVEVILEPPEPEEPPAPTFSEEEMAQAKTDAAARGREEAAREAAESTETAAAATLDGLMGKFDALIQAHRSVMENATGEAIAVAGAIARKLLPTTDTEIAMAEILHTIEQAMNRLYEEPAVVIRIAESLHDMLEPRLLDIVKQCAYPGAVTVVADPNLPVEDCRVEWGNGGVERDLSALWADVETIIARNTGLHIDELEMAPALEQETPEPAENAVTPLQDAAETVNETQAVPTPAPAATDVTDEGTDDVTDEVTEVVADEASDEVADAVAEAMAAVEALETIPALEDADTTDENADELDHPQQPDGPDNEDTAPNAAQEPPIGDDHG